MKYEAFISYRHAVSKEFAENLELALKAYAKPLWRPPYFFAGEYQFKKRGKQMTNRDFGWFVRNLEAIPKRRF